MNWLRFTVFTSDLGLELLSGIFTMPGLNGYRVFESKEQLCEELSDSAKYWDYVDIEKIAPYDEPSMCTLFADLPENAHLIDELSSAIKRFSEENSEFDLGSLRITVETIPEEDWANNWKQYYKPMEIGNKLFICPSWEQVPEHGEREVISIDPGMAFGAGTHETTKMCMLAAEKFVKAGDSVADLGCGSGILSIAAGKLGAEKLVCADVDPACIKVTCENVETNNQSITAFVGDVLSEKIHSDMLSANNGSKFNIVFANIVAGILIPLAPSVKSLLVNDGIFISSGIISDRLEEVLASYKSNGLTIIDVHSIGDWSAVIAKIA